MTEVRGTTAAKHQEAQRIQTSCNAAGAAREWQVNGKKEEFPNFL